MVTRQNKSSQKKPTVSCCEQGKRFVLLARQEFHADVAKYQGIDPEIGAEFPADVEDATARALVYRLDDQGITVYAVAHHARKPGY